MAYAVCHAPLKFCEMLLEHIIGKCDFLKRLIHTQIIHSSVSIACRRARLRLNARSDLVFLLTHYEIQAPI